MKNYERITLCYDCFDCPGQFPVVESALVSFVLFYHDCFRFFYREEGISTGAPKSGERECLFLFVIEESNMSICIKYIFERNK